MRKVLIGIQARSDSQRLPNKCHLQIGGKPILQWIIDTANHAIRYLGQSSRDLESEFECALLVPKGDPIVSIYRNQILTLEGDHDDVLSRFANAGQHYDYIVRLTADCLEMPAHIIAKHVRSALIKERDYTTNVYCRSFREGWDCEVLSNRLLRWLDDNAVTPFDREHVTTLISPDKPFPFQDSDGKKNICHIINSRDESHIKTSIDTREEYEAAQKAFEKFQDTKNKARRSGVYVT